MALRITSNVLLTLMVIQSCFNLILASPSNRVWVVRRDVAGNSAVNNQPLEKTPPRIYSMEVVSDIKLRYASTKVTSRVANPSTEAQESTFHVVLPDTAFISGFLMEIDGKVYKASVKEKEKAQEEYQGAVDAGQSAAQVTADARDANQFTVSVNIEPKAKMLFNLTYEELLTRRRGIYEQVIHVNPGAIVPKMSVKINIFETLPINKITVPQLRGNDIGEQDNTENEVAQITRQNETVVHVVYEPTEIQQKKYSDNGLQGQFVVQYDVDRSSIERKGGEIHVVDGYFVHFFAPSTLPTLPKHVVFVLDTSGSMAGTRIEQTKQAMNSILDQLRADDLFSVVEFSSEVTEWDLRKPYKGPESSWLVSDESETKHNETITEQFGLFDDIFAYPVTDRSIKRAKEFVTEMAVTSATNINDALLLALRNTQSVQSRLRLTPIIIFLTDGEPTSGVVDKDSILSNVRKANGDNVVSIFSLAFGTGTDYDFLTKVSSQNRGFARKIYEAADATLQLKGFFDEVASPLLTNVRFVYNNNGPIQDVTETKVSNYFKGTEFVVAGKIEDSSNLTASISGIGATGPYVSNDILPFPLIPFPPILKKNTTVAEKNEKFSLEKIWAYLTIQDMLKKRQVVDDAKTIAQFNEKALNLSLSYGFVTPLTSLVVVKPNGNVSPADVRPADGQSSEKHAVQSLGYPAPGSFAAAPFGAGLSAGGIGLQFSPPMKFRPVAMADRSTTYRPFLGTTDNFFQPESFESASTPDFTDSESTTDTNIPVFSPVDFVKQFEHNATHANVPMGNETLALLWQDELPDIQYNPCTANYTKFLTTGFCKSIWKCPVFERNIEVDAPIDTTSSCVINNTYLGICCVSSEDTTLLPDSTPQN